MFTRTKIVVLLFAMLVYFGIAIGSSPLPMWSNMWRLEVYNLYCNLGKEYSVPGYRKYHESLWADPNQGAIYNPPHKGPLEGTAYFRLLAGFKINSRSHGAAYPSDLVDENRFYFFLYPEENYIPEKYLDPDDERAQSVTINGEEAAAENEYTYYLSVEKTKTVFDLHTQDQPIQISIVLNDGEVRQLDISPFPPEQFSVWAAMLETCARENLD